MRKFDHHIGDYAAATAHLTLVEDAVYHRLLRHYYMTEEALPGDHTELCRLVRARTKTERRAVDSVVAEFFYSNDDGRYQQDRCEREIVLTRERSDDANTKKNNEKSRMQRHRDERAHLFAGLAAKGVTPRWNLPMAELRTIAASYGVRSLYAVEAEQAAQDAQQSADLQRACNAPATANHQPTTNHQPPTTPDTHSGATDTTSGASQEAGHETVQVEEADATAQSAKANSRQDDGEVPGSDPLPTPAGRVCLAMRRAGVSDVNPGHPDLLALLKAGCSDDEFVWAATEAVNKGKGFGYALGALKGRRQDAAKQLDAMHKGTLPAVAGVVAQAGGYTASLGAIASRLTGGARRQAQQAAAAQPLETVEVVHATR